MSATADDLERHLNRIDGRGYKAYKDIRGSYAFPAFTLHIDHVQGDPFAAPSRLRLEIPQDRAGFPPASYHHPARRHALAHYLALAFAEATQASRQKRGSGNSGLLSIDRPGQQILQRTCMTVDNHRLEARFTAGLPASGRRVLGGQAAEMLCRQLPDLVDQSLFYRCHDPEQLTRWGDTAEDADFLRAALAQAGLIAFIADGAVLPRRSGVDDRPLPQDAQAFQSPASLRVSFDLPCQGRVTGLGLPPGITLIAGGGFHGKSTLLNALERGVHNHSPQDGRQLVVCHPGAVKIRAEDGRRVASVDISPFINGLPNGVDTSRFSTDNASGSTSQAANIAEALEAGAQVLLIDEDTAATNFMIRDQRMQRLIQQQHEPITPLIDRVRSLYEDHGVSTVLVAGGSGNYFDVADHVIAMEAYQPRDATQQARHIAAQLPTARRLQETAPFALGPGRVPVASSLDPSRGRRPVSASSRGLETLLFGETTIDLSGLEQLVDPSQPRALAAALVHIWRHYLDNGRSIAQILDALDADIAAHGLDAISPHPVGDHALFRRFELAAALNRLRSLHIAAPA